MSSDPVSDFQAERMQRIREYSQKKEFQKKSLDWMNTSVAEKYVYNFEWLGRPVIQYPQDLLALQEVIWEVKPDLIIETGIAHGGSLVFSASLLALLDLSSSGLKSRRKVLGIDIDIREHNRSLIDAHPLSFMIDMFEGSSIDSALFSKVMQYSEPFSNILVILDSMHTHDHVFEELNLYSSLVTKGSYCIVLDTFVSDLADNSFPDRPWSKSNSPKTAVHSFLRKNDDFELDKAKFDKLMISSAPDGFLKRTR